MFDPNMMNMMNQMMSNPETMKKMEEMMQNPDFMSNAMNMMKDPSMASLFGNLPTQQNNEENNDSKREVEDDTETIHLQNKFSENDIITLVNLSSDSYNNQECIVKSFNSSTQRYNVYVKSLDKIISVKEINMEFLDKDVIEVN